MVANEQDRSLAGPPSALASLRRLVVQAEGSGIDTSEGGLFNHSVWGRDRAITALDMIEARPELARQSVFALARLQGVACRARSEEEPGRIHNEHRDLDAWVAPWWLKPVFRYMLAPLWGGTPHGYTEYFAADSTPLYIQLVARCASLEQDFLDARVTRRDGSETTVRRSALAAALWLVDHMSQSGLIETRKRNPISLPSPTWKDGPTSNLDADGRILNVLAPVAWLLVQVLTVDAFRQLAAVVDGRGRGSRSPSSADAALADSLRDLANAAQAALLREFWIDELQYFGFAVDRGVGGRRRVAAAVQSDAGWLLDSTVFDELAPEDRRRYVSGIVRRLFRADMITSAGLRGRSMAFSDERFINYHETVWPMDTLKVARGLRRQRFPELAALLEDRLLNTINALGSHYEFVPVDAFGRVIDPRREAPGPGGRSRRPLAAEMEPDHNLAWSVTGVLRLKRERGRERLRPREDPTPREPWVTDLTEEILAQVRPVPPARGSGDLAALKQDFAPYYLSHWRGLLRSAATIAVEGFGRALPAGYVYLLAGGDKGCVYD